jgi:putative ABC transport system permease protein
MANIMPAVGPGMKDAFPEIEQSVRIRRLWDIPIEFDHGEVFIEEKVFAAEPSILDVFTLPLAEGDPKTVLDAPLSLIISQKVSRDRYGEESPIGKTLKLSGEHEFQITGVLADIPLTTQIRSDFIVSYSSLEKIGENTDSWTAIFQDYTYLLLHAEADPGEIEQKIPGLLASNLEPDIAKMYELQLQPLSSIFLNSKLSYELPPQGNLGYIYVFSSVAALILIIACMNFINLATARTSHRMREVGVRKVLGAFRGQLIRQFLSESVLLTVLSMVFGIMLFEFVKPLWESFLGREMAINLYGDPILFLAMLGMIVIVGVLSGSYPAFILSRSRPAAVLKDDRSRKISRAVVRKVLIASQFVIAIMLLCATFVVFKQINFSATSDLGFDHDNIVLIDVEEGISDEIRQTIKNEIINNNLAVSAAISNIAPGENRWTLTQVRPENKRDDDPTLILSFYADDGFLNTFGIDLIEGRNFSQAAGAESKNSIIVNEEAVREFGMENPIGFRFFAKSEEYQVIGVVKDFNTHSLHNQIMPCMISSSKSDNRLLSVKMHSNDIQEAIAGIRVVWNDIQPNSPLEYKFLDDAIKENYNDEEKIGYLFSAFSIMAVFIACLGLFGLAAFMAEKRTKEIGIRKVLGASVSSIIQLLFKEFLILAVISTALACPIAYFAMSRWLEEFAYRTGIGIEVYALAGGITLSIALATVSYQAIRAACANPVQALKYE